MTLLDFDTTNRRARSASAEWQPHRRQTPNTGEWWYFTALAHDSAGTPYFLNWTQFSWAGEANCARYDSIAPDAVAQAGEGQLLQSGLIGFTNYRTGERHFGGDVSTMSIDDLWNEETRTLSFISPRTQARWSYHGDHQTLVLSSDAVGMSLDFTGAESVLWAKDSAFRTKGFIQEGEPGNVSFYYTLAQLRFSGSIRYRANDGRERQVQVTGFGWVDRQWGDFTTSAWEWASLRFNSGARVNLYNFPNGHQIAAHQRPDGSVEYFEAFTVRQNGYLRTPLRGIWISSGWTYELPISIDGVKKFTVTPYDAADVFERTNVFYEGAGRLVDADTGEDLGVCINESMDVRAMNNAPYGLRQF